MKQVQPRGARVAWLLAIAAFSLLGVACVGRTTPLVEAPMKLSHEQTLEWIRDNHTWRRATKTKPIWARPVEKDELGKAFQTADQAVEHAKEGYWLCVGVAGEPWFQKREKIDAKYDRTGDEQKQFDFDKQPRSYHVYKPKEGNRNWVAQVKGTWKGAPIEGFSIRPGYDMDHPLSSPAGGYVVKNDVADPYEDSPKDVWLVQESLFNSTYELLP